MKITGVETLFFSAQIYGNDRNWLLVRIQTDEGLFGIGDASPLGNEMQTASLIEEWADKFLVGKDPLDTEAIWTEIYYNNNARGGRIETTALSGIDIALWDLKGKILNQPIYKLLGGAQQEKIRVYANGWYTVAADPKLNAEEAKKTVQMGYTAMKFDPFATANYYNISLEEAQAAEDRVAAVREAVGPDVDVIIEVHAKFSTGAAIALGQRMEQYRPMWFEEPTSQENVSEMKYVRDRVNIPIATGERLYTKFPFYELVKADAVDVLQPDIANAGGITELKKIAAIAEARHVSIAPHNTCSAVGTMAECQLDVTMTNFLIQEYHAQFYSPWYIDAFEGFPVQKDGYITLPDGPGLGIIPNDELIAAHGYVPPKSGRRPGRRI
jgi:galactonate dehydratase